MAITFIGGAFSVASATAGTTKTITYSPAAGNTLLIFGFGAGAAIKSISDSVGNVYRQVAAPITNTTEASLWGTEPNASKVGTGATITVTFASSVRNTVCVVEYSGVAQYGNTGTATGSTANPTISVTTQDANNFIVAGFGSESTSAWTALTGTLRENQTAPGSTTPGSGIVDNTAAGAGSVTCAATHVAATWAGIAVELRTQTPQFLGGEDSDAWWAGANKCFSAIAIAGVLTASLFTAELAEGLHQYDDVNGNLSIPTFAVEPEFVYQIVQPSTQIIPIPYSQPVGIPTNPLDDGLWQQQQPPPFAQTWPQPFSFQQDDVVQQVVTFQPDEDFQSPALAVWPIAPSARLYFFDTDDAVTQAVAPVQDEDYWQQFPIAAPGSYRQPFLESDDFVGFQPDEDYWQNPVAPIQATNWIQKPLTEREDFVGFTPDEDYWNVSIGVPASNRWPQQFTFDNQESVPQPVIFQPDEDYALAFPVTIFAANKQPFIEADDFFAYQVDEDFWTNAVLPVPASNWQSLPYFFDTPEIVPQPTIAPADEAYWINSVAPVPSLNAWPQQFPFETGDTGNLSCVPVDDAWNPLLLQSPVKTVSAYWFDAGEVAPFTPDEDYWQSALPAPRAAQSLYAFDQADAPFPQMVDEDFWMNPVRPVSLSMLLYSPWMLDQDFARGSASRGRSYAFIID